jgi:ketosteroid isomerase-like protein
MRKSLFIVSLIAICATLALAQRGAPMPPATGPGAEMANASLEAINKADAAYFEKHLATDVVWLDEDGHAIRTKDRVLNFIKTKLLTGGKKVMMTSLTAGNSTDAAWSTYFYTIDAAGAQRKGTMTSIYKKVGNDWQIVLVHGAVNAMGHQ